MYPKDLGPNESNGTKNLNYHLNSCIAERVVSYAVILALKEIKRVTKLLKNIKGVTNLGGTAETIHFVLKIRRMDCFILSKMFIKEPVPNEHVHKRTGPK